jgi:hypothetical protein
MSNRTLACSVMLAFALAPVGAQAPAKEELKLKLPKPMFIGTPTNLRSPNLEVTGKSRGPFMVPKGTTLLSLKKKVTSSDSAPVIGELDMLTDGEKAGGDGFFGRRVLRRARADAAVGAGRSRGLVSPARHPVLAFPQPGARLPRRHRPGVG